MSEPVNGDYLSPVKCRKCCERTAFEQVGHLIKCTSCGWVPTGPVEDEDA